LVGFIIFLLIRSWFFGGSNVVLSTTKYLIYPLEFEHQAYLEEGEVLNIYFEVTQGVEIDFMLFDDENAYLDKPETMREEIQWVVPKDGTYTFGFYPWETSKVKIKITKSSPSEKTETSHLTEETENQQSTQFVVSNLNFEPSSSVEADVPVKISVKVTNTGDSEGTFTVELFMDGEVENSQSVSLSRGESKVVAFTVGKLLPKIYSVEINGLSGYLTIECPFEVSDMILSKNEAVAGETVVVSVVISNPSDNEKSCLLPLLVGNQIVSTELVTLPAWTSQTVSFTLQENTPGTYTVQIDEHQETLTVLTKTIALWHLDGNANDETVNGYDGTISGATLTLGRFKGAYEFGGVDDYIMFSVPSGTHILNDLPEWTFEAWIFPTGENGIIYSEDAASGITMEVYLLSDGSLRVSTWNYYMNPWWMHYSTPQGVVTFNEWNYIAITLENGDIGSGLCKVYVNGSFVGSGQLQKECGTSYTYATLGCNAGSVKGTQPIRAFKGIIDEVRISRVARTSEEIVNHYSSETPHFVD